MLEQTDMTALAIGVLFVGGLVAALVGAQRSSVAEPLETIESGTTKADEPETALSQPSAQGTKASRGQVWWMVVPQLGVYLFPVLLGYATQSVLAGVAAYALAACVLSLASTSTDMQVATLEKELAVLRNRIERL